MSGAADLPKRVSVRRMSGLRHEVCARHHCFTVDEPLELGGSDTAASPLELLAAALATCSAATIEMYAARKGWESTGIEVDVQLIPAHGDLPAQFELVLRLPPTLPADRRERLERIARACPVRRALDGAEVVERVETVA